MDKKWPNLRKEKRYHSSYSNHRRGRPEKNHLSANLIQICIIIQIIFCVISIIFMYYIQLHSLVIMTSNNITNIKSYNCCKGICATSTPCLLAGSMASSTLFCLRARPVTKSGYLMDTLNKCATHKPVAICFMRSFSIHHLYHHILCNFKTLSHCYYCARKQCSVKIVLFTHTTVAYLINFISPTHNIKKYILIVLRTTCSSYYTSFNLRMLLNNNIAPSLRVCPLLHSCLLHSPLLWYLFAQMRLMRAPFVDYYFIAEYPQSHYIKSTPDKLFLNTNVIADVLHIESNLRFEARLKIFKYVNIILLSYHKQYIILHLCKRYLNNKTSPLLEYLTTYTMEICYRNGPT